MQVESAKSHLQGKQRALKDLSNVCERHGKVCSIFHTSGVNPCKLKDKHSELLADIHTLRRELKELEQQFMKVKSEHDVFATSRQ